MAASRRGISSSMRSARGRRPHWRYACSREFEAERGCAGWRAPDLRRAAWTAEVSCASRRAAAPRRATEEAGAAVLPPCVGGGDEGVASESIAAA